MDEAAASEGTNLIILYIGVGLTTLAGTVLVLYNLVVLIGVLRAKDPEKASNLSKAAWGLSFAVLFLGPCAAPLGLVAALMGVVETGRVYREQSTLASTTGARMAKTNGGVIITLSVVLSLFAMLTFMG